MCPTQHYFVNPTAFKSATLQVQRSCVQNLFSIRLLIQIGSRLTFQRNHKRATICNGLKPLLHLRAHYHLSTTFHTITLQTTAGTTLCTSLTPLSILHVPCNSSFEDQEIDLGKRPRNYGIFSPYFSVRSIFLHPLVACHKWH